MKTNLRETCTKVLGEPKSADECVDALLKLWNSPRIATPAISEADSRWLADREAEIEVRAQESERYSHDILGE
jgi:hypothetical protein